MLGHGGAGTRRHQRRSGRDIEGGDRPATGPGGVDEMGRIHFDPHHRRPQRPCRPGHLVGGFPLHAQRHEQPADLGGGRFAAHHDAEHFGGVGFAQ